MQIAQITNNQVTKIGNYWDLFPSTSFPVSGPDADFLTANSCLQVNLFLTYDPLTQYLETVAPYVNGNYVYTVQVAQLSADQITANKATALAQIRTTRNNLLSACDYTQAADNPTTKKAAWATYRQALRDIPQNMGTADPRTWNSWPNNPDYVAPTQGS